MLQHITLTGKYTGIDKRGIIIGGVPFYPGMNLRTVRVDEDTFLSLRRGVENNWFHISEHNYNKFLVSRFRKVETINRETKVIKDTDEKINDIDKAINDTNEVIEEIKESIEETNEVIEGIKEVVEETKEVVDEVVEETKEAPKKRNSQKKKTVQAE